MQVGGNNPFSSLIQKLNLNTTQRVNVDVRELASVHGTKQHKLSGYISTGVSPNGSIARPLKGLFFEHIKLQVGDKSVMVRTDQLKKLLNISTTKVLQEVLADSQGNLDAYLEKAKVEQPTLQTQTSHVNTVAQKYLTKQVIYNEGNISSIKMEKKGEVHTFVSQRKLGAGNFKDVFAFEKIGGAVRKPLAYAAVRPDSSTGKLRSKDVAELKLEFGRGKQLHDNYKAKHGGHVPFVKQYTMVHEQSDQSEHVGMLMEQCGTDVYNGYSSLSAADKGVVLLDIARGVASMHEQGIAHNDLKLENALTKTVMDNEGNTSVRGKLIDFGLSSNASDPRSRSGSLAYFSPEVIQGNSNVDAKAADAWALGVMLYELHFANNNGLGTLGYETGDMGKTFKETPDKIVEGMLAFQLKLKPHQRDPVVKVIQGLMHMDPKKRLTPQKAVKMLESLDKKNMLFLGRLT